MLSPFRMCVATSFYQRPASRVYFFAFFNLRNLLYLIYQLCTILQTIQKSFMLIGCAETTAEAEYGIIIFRWQMSQQVIQFTEAITDIRWGGFMGFLIDFLLSVYITRLSDL